MLPRLLVSASVSFAALILALGCENLDTDSQTNESPKTIVEAAEGRGLRASYFNNPDLSGSPALEKVDSQINFDWGKGSPSSKIKSDGFSVRWTGFMKAKFSETYTFYTYADDGVKVWVDGELIIDDWSNHSARERSGKIKLKAGMLHALKVEYYDYTSRARCKLRWSSDSQSKEAIPAEKLFLTDQEDTTDIDTNTDSAMTIEERTNGFCYVEGLIQSEHDGYHGRGYANTDNAVGTSIEWSVSSRGGAASMTWRYASKTDRPAKLSINGQNVSTVAFSRTGGWTSWLVATSSVVLVPGQNAIRLTSQTNDGLANIDNLTVLGDDLTAGVCGADTDTDSDNEGDSNSDGIIRITDNAPGWASVAGGTTGGGKDLSSAITVSSMSALEDAVSGSDSAIIRVKPGVYKGTLSPGSNKTIIGTSPGVLINGSLQITGSDSHNVIIRNIAVQGEHCSSYDECKEGLDAVYIGKGAHHIWLDHMDIYDGQDGNCDITKAADYITISWTRFRYTYDKPHRFSNLIAGSDSETESRGKLRITYMDCWWGDRVEQRQPRGRFGKVHCFNNLYASKASNQYCAGPGLEMAMIIENCFYDVHSGTKAIKDSYGEPKGWRATGNKGNADGKDSSYGTTFDIPYDYDLILADDVEDAVKASQGGAGTTCTLH